MTDSAIQIVVSGNRDITIYFVALEGLGRLRLSAVSTRNVEVDGLIRRLGGNATSEVAGEIVAFGRSRTDNVVMTIGIGGCARDCAGVGTPIIDRTWRTITCAITVEDAIDM